MSRPDFDILTPLYGSRRWLEYTYLLETSKNTIISENNTFNIRRRITKVIEMRWIKMFSKLHTFKLHLSQTYKSNLFIF